MSKKNQELKQKVSMEIELIKSQKVNASRDFEAYLEENYLTPQALTYLFEEAPKEMVKIYVNKVYPSFGKPEFKKYQTQVMAYGNRKTLATYYMYYEVSPNGEIELIKREEVNPFVFYVVNHGLSDKAFKYLIKNGSSELIESYLNNKELETRLLPFFINNASIEDLIWYYVTSTPTEKGLFIEFLQKSGNKKVINKLSDECEMIQIALAIPPKH